MKIEVLYFENCPNHLPTVRVNGVDIEPKAEERKEFGLMCRRYASGIPSQALIREAVRSASVGGNPQRTKFGA
jgi:hypothetical protein